MTDRFEEIRRDFTEYYSSLTTKVPEADDGIREDKELPRE